VPDLGTVLLTLPMILPNNVSAESIICPLLFGGQIFFASNTNN